MKWLSFNGMIININLRDVLFGHDIDNEENLVITVIMLGKMFIFKCKYNERGLDADFLFNYITQ